MADDDVAGAPPPPPPPEEEAEGHHFTSATHPQGIPWVSGPLLPLDAYQGGPPSGQVKTVGARAMERRRRDRAQAPS